MSNRFSIEEIHKHLLRALTRSKRLGLPGLGTFEIIEESAEIDYQASKVKAPYHDLHFNQLNDLVDKDFEEFLITRAGISELQARVWVADFVRSVWNQTTSETSYFIEHIGAFVKESEQLSFVADGQWWGKKSVEGHMIKFTPVPRFKEDIAAVIPPVASIPAVISNDIPQKKTGNLEEMIEKEDLQSELDVDISNTSDVISTKESTSKNLPEELEEAPIISQKRKNNFKDQAYPKKPSERSNKAPLYAGLVLLIACGAAWFLWQKIDVNSSESQNQTIVDQIPSDRLNKKPKEKEAIILPTDSNAKMESDTPDNTENPKAVREKNEIPQDGEYSAKDPVETKTSLAELNKTKSNKNTTTKSKNNKTISGIVANNIENCVIVVGAFGNQNNLQRMKKKLESAGLKTYIDSSRSLNRIGFYSECQGDQMKYNLGAAREQISAGSWLLKP